MHGRLANGCAQFNRALQKQPIVHAPYACWMHHPPASTPSLRLPHPCRGGLIVTPLLALTMDYPQATVLGTSLLAMIFPASAALLQHQRCAVHAGGGRAPLQEGWSVACCPVGWHPCRRGGAQLAAAAAVLPAWCMPAGV